MTKLTAQECDFVNAARTMLALGTRPSARAVFMRLIESGQSSRDKRSILKYGPGARFTRLHKVVTAEWDDFVSRGGQDD